MSPFRRPELPAARMIVLVAALVCLVLAATAAQGQGPVDGALHGTIVDGDGNAIAAASGAGAARGYEGGNGRS